jgi:hypothetical protein
MPEIPLPWPPEPPADDDRPRLQWRAEWLAGQRRRHQRRLARELLARHGLDRPEREGVAHLDNYELAALLVLALEA